MCFLLADLTSFLAATGIHFPTKQHRATDGSCIDLILYQSFGQYCVVTGNVKNLPTRDERSCYKNIQAAGNPGVALVSSHYRLHFGVPVSLSPTSPRLFLFPFNLFQLASWSHCLSLRHSIVGDSSSALRGWAKQHSIKKVKKKKKKKKKDFCDNNSFGDATEHWKAIFSFALSIAIEFSCSTFKLSLCLTVLLSSAG